jgi:hypothetical protein
MFQLDDNFLQSVGLGGMPAAQKQAFLQHIYEELELRVGTQLSEGLSDDQLKEFESFMNGDEDKIRGWLQVSLPGYEQSEDYTAFRKNVPPETPELAVLAEYASLKWLEVNRPNYKEVVAAELGAEISANRDQILGTAA